MGLPERMLNCCQIHWSGFFLVLSPLVLLPMIFMEPVKEYRAIYILLIMFLWFIFEPIVPPIISLIPVVFLPLLGVVPSADVCMAFTYEPQIVLLCTTFIGIAIEKSNLSKRYAFSILNSLSFDPKIVLVILMVMAFILAFFLPSGFVCALMIPIVRSILEILDNISVCKSIDESVVLKDDETPCPTKVATAFYLGVAYATNIGAFSTALSSDTGFILRDLIQNDTSLSPLDDMFFVKYCSITLVMALLLLSFTILNLLCIFLGFMRKESPAAQQIVYDKAASQTALETVRNNLPPYDAPMIMTAVFYFTSWIGVLVIAILRPEIDNNVLRFSVNAMFLSFLYFVLPKACYFCHYFNCTKPSQYKAIPSILPWSAIQNTFPWKNYFIFGGSSATGLTMKATKLHMFVGDSLLTEKSTGKQKLGLLTITVILTIMGGNHFIADMMLNMGNAAKGSSNGGSYLFPIAWCVGVTFLLPFSSLANVYATGYGNVRTKHMLLAGIGPSIFGLLVAFILAIAMESLEWYN